MHTVENDSMYSKYILPGIGDFKYFFEIYICVIKVGVGLKDPMQYLHIRCKPNNVWSEWVSIMKKNFM